MQFLRSAGLIGICTFLSRILGLVRENLMGRVFGAGFVMDAFAMAFQIPNLFRRLFGEGALSAAFIPLFVERLEKDGKEKAFRVLNVVFTYVALVLSGLMLLGFAVTFVLPSVSSDKPFMALVCQLLQVMLPYLPLICLTALLGGALNSMNHFTAPALAPVLLNICWIGGLVGCFVFRGEPTSVIFIVAWSVLLGGVVGFIFQVLPLMRFGAKARFRLKPEGSELKEIFTLMLPVVFGLSIYQINEFVDYMIAKGCVPGEGAVSSLWFANRIIQVPMAVIGTAIATAVFPMLSAQLAQEKPNEFTRLFQKALRSCFFIAIPTTLCIAILAPWIVELLYEYGKFEHAATVRVARVALFGALGIWCYSANQLLVRAFYAQKDMKTPVWVSVVMVLVNLALNLILVWPLQEAGLALSTSISGFLNFVVLVAILRKRFPFMDFQPVMRTFFLSAALSMAISTLCFGLIEFGLVPLCESIHGVVLKRLLIVFVPMVVAVGLYALSTARLKMEEAHDFASLWLRRRK